MATNAVAVGLLLLERAGNERTADADDFTALVSLASTCSELRAAFEERRTLLAQICWLRAFGAETLGACATWQRIEQLGGTAFEARWRWLRGLRSSKFERKESIVEHTLPTKTQLHELEVQFGADAFNDYFRDDDEQLRFWFVKSAAFATVGGAYGDAFTETLVATGDDMQCCFTFALRTGTFQCLKVGRGRDEGFVTFGGIGVGLVQRSSSVELVDLTADATLHSLCRSAEPPFTPPDAHNAWEWASKGKWSVDGKRLALWGKTFTATDGVVESPTTPVYIFNVDPADALQSGPLASTHMLLLPKFASIAFGFGDCIYTAIDNHPATTATLRALDISSGEIMCEKLLAYYDPQLRMGDRQRCRLVPASRSELCLCVGEANIHVHCATTLDSVGTLAHPPLRGGHGSRVEAMSGVADLLLSCDAGGILLVWHVPTRQLLRRIGRNAVAVPGSVVWSDDNTLALTSRGAAVLETEFSSRSWTRFYDWLP